MPLSAPRLVTIPRLVATVACLALTACSASPAATNAPATSAPSAAASASAGSAAAACATAPVGASAAVTVDIKNLTFNPDPVTAKVGDVIAWTNSDTVKHTASLDDGTCETEDLATGVTGALVFNAPGTYPYHCDIHSGMKGTIQIR